MCAAGCGVPCPTLQNNNNSLCLAHGWTADSSACCLQSIVRLTSPSQASQLLTLRQANCWCSGRVSITLSRFSRSMRAFHFGQSSLHSLPVAHSGLQFESHACIMLIQDGRAQVYTVTATPLTQGTTNTSHFRTRRATAAGIAPPVRAFLSSGTRSIRRTTCLRMRSS